MAKDVEINIRVVGSEADLLEQAWGLIANAFPFDGDHHTPGWHEAATRWRDEYHRWLSGHLSQVHPIGDHFASCENRDCPGCI
jgi:hypothetical protein